MLEMQLHHLGPIPFVLGEVGSPIGRSKLIETTLLKKDPPSKIQAAEVNQPHQRDLEMDHFPHFAGMFTRLQGNNSWALTLIG